METNTKPRYIYRFKDENDCISYEWKEVSKEANMKIDVEESLIYKFDNKTDLSYGVEMLGEKGYFSNDESFSDYVYGTLVEVKCCMPKSEYPFVNATDFSYRYFIPEDAVAFKEREDPKGPRPFKSMKEFFDETGFNIGDVIQIKRFGNGNYTYEEKSIINGFRVFIDEESHSISVIFGSCSRSFEDLFQNFKYLKNNKWLPFSIEE